jgi:hypothetical protein
VAPHSPLIFVLTQHGSRVTGTVPWKGCVGKPGTSVEGNVRGDTFTGTFAFRGTVYGDQTMTLAADDETMSGTYRVIKAVGGCAAGLHGTFNATRI